MYIYIHTSSPKLQKFKIKFIGYSLKGETFQKQGESYNPSLVYLFLKSMGNTCFMFNFNSINKNK